MNIQFTSKKISGLLLVVPQNERTFDEDVNKYNFPVTRSMQLKKVMGFDKHRVVEENVTSSDLAVYGLNHLFDNDIVTRDEIDALVVVTQTPDHFLPATSFIIHGNTGLKKDIFCLDINQGCAGYLVGLFQSFSLLDQSNINKVALINVDVLSRKVSQNDRNSYPVIGDAASISIIENSSGDDIYGNIQADGNGNKALMIPAGGMKMPSSADTSILNEASDGNIRSLDSLVMDGSAVFNFVQTHVPPMIDELLAKSGFKINDIDYFTFHQPNKFMLEKLAQKMNIDKEKMPNNLVEVYGNSSGVTIPATIVLNFKDQLKINDFRFCLAGFGVGLTWASAIMRIGNLDFIETIEY